MSRRTIAIFFVLLSCLLLASSYAEADDLCPHCNKMIVADSRFCSYCGINVENFAVQEDPCGQSDLSSSEALLVQTSKENLAPYFQVMGAEISNGTPKVSQEFIDNLNSVHLMGYVGSVTHGYNQYDSGTYIELLTWTSNNSVTKTEFDDFIKQLNIYFGYEAILADFENIADETWQWLCYDEMCDALAWYEDGYINISWDWVLEVIGEKMPVLSPAKEKATQKPISTLVPTSSPRLVPMCEVDKCYNDGIESYTNPFSGQKEYYCKTHYNEMMKNIEYIFSSYCGMDGCYNKGTKKWVNFSNIPEYYCEKHYNDLMEALEYFGF